MPVDPMPGLDARLAREVTVVLQRMAKQQAGKKQVGKTAKLVTKQASKDEYMLALDGLKDRPDTRKSDSVSTRFPRRRGVEGHLRRGDQ